MSASGMGDIAELNVGRLVGLPDDPREAQFLEKLDRINGLGKRMPGFVWIMEGSGAPGSGNTENNIGEDPQSVANLTVWEDVDSPENFVWNTVHKRFYERRHEWFQGLKDKHFVMWRVPAGHCPSMEEALERLEYLRVNGDSDYAFGRGFLTEEQPCTSHRCEQSLVE